MHTQFAQEILTPRNAHTLDALTRHGVSMNALSRALCKACVRGLTNQETGSFRKPSVTLCKVYTTCHYEGTGRDA